MHRARLERHGDPNVVVAIEDRDYPRGERNVNWTGEDASYQAVHQRLRRVRGNAREHQCVDCSEDASQWSYSELGGCWARMSEEGPYSVDLDDYKPRCASCHKRFDLVRLPIIRAMAGA